MIEQTLQKGVKNKVLFFKWDSDCLFVCVCVCVCGGAVAGERPYSTHVCVRNCIHLPSCWFYKVWFDICILKGCDQCIWEDGY